MKGSFFFFNTGIFQGKKADLKWCQEKENFHHKTWGKSPFIFKRLETNSWVICFIIAFN